ncbi:phenylacetyl-CoA ligase [Amylocystis lapponica]|nr:phenylacetyl-CoA ligase [Amylocystis lapponica]
MHYTGGTLPDIPDDLTIPQFFLGTTQSPRPIGNEHTSCLLQESTGSCVHIEEASGQLRVRTNGLANTLKLRWNIGEGDVVCIIGPNHIDYPVIIWAVHMLGGIVTAADPSFSTAEELGFSLKTTAASFLVIHPDFMDSGLSSARDAHITMDRIVIFDPTDSTRPSGSFPVLGNLISDGSKLKPQYLDTRLSPGEARSRTAFLSFSSGTSGIPKATAISHYAVIANVIQRAAYNRVDDDSIPLAERRFRPGDVSAAAPFYAILRPVVVPKFDFQAFLKTIVRHQMSHLFLVPAQAVLLCKNPMYKNYDLSCVRLCVVGAGALSPDSGRDLLQVFPKAILVLGYGMTEMCSTICMTLVSQVTGASGCVGRLLPGISARVLREDRSTAGKGEPGELWVTGPAVASGYANDSIATRDVFVDGWVQTGDQVYFDDDGGLHIVDRLKDIFKVRGFQVAPAELEEHLLTHPDVSDACVVGIPDEHSGEVPVAYVALCAPAAERVKADLNEAKKTKISILKHVASAKASYKWIAGGVEFVESLPRNPNGKLQRRILRQQATEARSRAAAVRKQRR